MSSTDLAVAIRARRPLERTVRSWTRADSIALTVIVLIGGAIRWFRATAVSNLVFDEVYYATRSCEYVYGTRPPCNARILEGLAPVHPPLGTWLIAIGIRMFGYRSGGWRLASLAAGTLSIVVLYLLGRRLLRSTIGATVASGALAFDFLHFVHSRVAMLDVFVTFFAVAAFLFAAYDRDRSATGEQQRGPERRVGRWRERRWRLLAGLVGGAALASKWSGLWVLLTVAALTFGWELVRRPGSWQDRVRRTGREEGPSMAVAFILLPAVVYVGSYVGRLDGSLLAWPWAQDSWVRAFLGQQRRMLDFHLWLSIPHVYSSEPWSWLLLKRPVVYHVDVSQGRYTEILAVGNPVAWWPAMVALAWIAVRWLRHHRSNGEAVILAGFLAGWLPWLVLAPMRGTTFLFYLLPAVPFMCLALGYVAAAIEHAAFGRTAVVAFAVVLLASFAYFYPVLAALPVSADAWRSRILFADCDLRGLRLSDIALPEGVSPPPDRPGPYPEATMREGPPPGWCWI